MNPHIKNALLEIISCMLSHNTEVRVIAEERKKALEITEDYGIHLLEIILTTEEALEERQLAAVLLKQYVDLFWNQKSIPPQIKEKIKHFLPVGLSDASSKIRNHVAYITACVAVEEFPNQWPNMCEHVFTGEPDVPEKALGLINFIANFARSASSEQIELSYVTIYNFLYRVCENVEKYNLTTRGECIQCIVNLLCIHFEERELKDGESEIVMKFCELFTNHLVLSHPTQSNYELKSHILRGFTLLLEYIPNTAFKLLLESLPVIWQILSRCGDIYLQILSDCVLPERDPTEDEDDEPKFYSVTFDILELLYNLTETNNFVSMPSVRNVLPDLLSYLIMFMGILKETELSWKSNESNYVADEFMEDYLKCAVRFRSRDLLLLISLSVDSSDFVPALTTAIEKHVVLSKSKGPSYYVRISEAIMFSLGSLNDYIISHYETNQLYTLNILSYLSEWGREIQTCTSPLLLPRIMWVGGRYAILLKDPDLYIFLTATIDNLEHTNFIIKYSAIRAIELHLKTISKTQTFLQIRQQLFDSLLFTLHSTSNDVLPVGLRAVSRIYQVDSSFVLRSETAIIHFIRKLFTRTMTCPDNFVSDIQGIIQFVGHYNGTWQRLENALLLDISQIISDTIATLTPSSYNYDSLISGINFLITLAVCSPKPISENLIFLGFFRVYSCMTYIDDNCVMQMSADCMRSLLYKASDQIMQCRDSDGKTGAGYVLSLIQYTLVPEKLEMAHKHFGRLCITAMRTLGVLLNEQIDTLLRNALSAMQKCTDVQVESSLIMVFAYLFNDHLDAVLNCLTVIPGPQGESALQFIVDKWFQSKDSAKQTKYEHHLSVLALAKLVEYTILRQDQRVANIKLDREPSCGTKVPAPLVILSYLVRLLAQSLGMHQENRSDTAAWVPRTKMAGESSIVKIDHSKMVRFDSLDYDATNEICDSLDYTDPIHILKLDDFLSNYFKNIACCPRFIRLIPYLDKWDLYVLNKLGIVITL